MVGFDREAPAISFSDSNFRRAMFSPLSRKKRRIADPFANQKAIVNRIKG